MVEKASGVDRFLDWLSALPAIAVYPILMVLAAVENVFPPVPADVAVVLGVFLSKEGVGSAWLIGALCWMSNTVSAAGMYFYARSKGKAFFETGLPRKVMPPKAVQALERAYARYGVLAIFVSRFLPAVRAAVTPFAGLVGVAPMRALVPAAAASLIWYAFLVVAGTALAATWEAARDMVEDTTRVLAWIGGVAAVAIAFWLWRRAREEDDGDKGEEV